MKVFLYRSTENDEDGDPYDWGTVKAVSREDAIKQIKKRLKHIGIDFFEAFYLYEQVEPKGAGFFENAKDRETVKL